jgi:hypothetical protein
MDGESKTEDDAAEHEDEDEAGQRGGDSEIHGERLRVGMSVVMPL